MAGNNLFGADIAGKVFAALNGQVLTATLTKIVAGTRTPGSLTAGTQPTTTNYAAQGFMDSKDRKNIGGTLVEDGEVIVVLLGNSIASDQVPEVGDKVTIESNAYWIKVIDRDPDKAAYTMICKSV
jgi:hypothetical protein